MESCCQSCRDVAEQFVCRCLRVSETTVIDALTTQPIRNLKELRLATGAGDGCTCCHRRLQQYIDEYAYSDSPICSVR
jgi:bacterioferritin-associated ferredoxin